jgi:hypothetical protein
MSPPPPTQPAGQPQQNVFQQSAGALGKAQQTASGLADFQYKPMQAATMGPAANMTPAQLAEARRMTPAQLAEAERMQAVGQVADITGPGQIDVDQLRTMDIAQYMNPYTEQVINAGQADIERQRQMASNQLGAQAQAAGAFGGSRQGVQEGVLAGEALRQAGQLSAQQRQSGFQQAIQSGQFDIGQTQAARTLESQQGMQASSLNQQAAEAGAAREQAARAGNMQAANMFAQEQARFEQQANMTNQAAQNARSAQQAQFEQAANAANLGAQFQGANVRAGAAGQLGGLSQTGFGQGMAISNQQMAQGAMQQALNQQLIDAAKGQYAGLTGAPQTSLGLPMAALGGAQYPTTTKKNPGLFDYLGLAAGIAAAPITGGGSLAGNMLSRSDIRLKTNIKPIGSKAGVNFYSWDWNEDGKRIADPKQPTVGVMAQELQKTHPHLVEIGSDGFLRVNYDGLAAEVA